MNPNPKSDQTHVHELIDVALKKLNTDKENDICQYIPMDTGGYIHHFTMRKMKTEQPQKLASWIKRYIIDQSKPEKVPPKQRAPRGSRKRRDQLLFSREDIERLRQMARKIGDKEMVRKLTPKKDLRTIRKELLQSVKRCEIDEELWNSYCEAVIAQNPHMNQNSQYTSLPTFASQLL